MYSGLVLSCLFQLSFSGPSMSTLNSQYVVTCSLNMILQIKKEIKQSRVRVTSKVFLCLESINFFRERNTRLSFIYPLKLVNFARSHSSISDPCLCWAWVYEHFLQVVDLINDSTSDVRPEVLISATAVGFYGISPNSTLCWKHLSIRKGITFILKACILLKNILCQHFLSDSLLLT